MPVKGSSIRGIIEIADGLDEAFLARLIRVAYASSRHGTIVIVLAKPARPWVQRILDAVVSELGIHVAGLLFKDRSRDESEIVELARSADFVAGATETFRARLLEAGIAPTSLAEAIAHLQDTLAGQLKPHRDVTARVAAS